MKRNVSVVCVCSAPNCCDTEQRSASQPGSVASGTPGIMVKAVKETKPANIRQANFRAFFVEFVHFFFLDYHINID